MISKLLIITLFSVNLYANEECTKCKKPDQAEKLSKDLENISHASDFKERYTYLGYYCNLLDTNKKPTKIRFVITPEGNSRVKANFYIKRGEIEDKNDKLIGTKTGIITSIEKGFTVLRRSPPDFLLSFSNEGSTKEMDTPDKPTYKDGRFSGTISNIHYNTHVKCISKYRKNEY